MIEFTKGDMFEVQVDARVNTVNCEGVMGAGVALAFKNRYPEMFKDYVVACREERLRPGTLHIWKRSEEWIINFPTKRGWRDPSRYEDILSGLEALRKYLLEQGPMSLALPALGCGHGGLEWSRVSLMIENSLGDLNGRIVVFEPADSRNAGRATKNRPTEDQLKALGVLGFQSSELSSWQNNDESAGAILVKGDPSLLARRWVGLLPSRQPTEREISALTAVGRQIALSLEPVPVALVHATRSTERIAEIFLNQGVAVVLILPFGPLTRESVAKYTADQRASFAMVSLAGPAEGWGRPILAQSMKLLRDGASSLLLSDPVPDWLNEKTIRAWSERPIFYLRYESLGDAVRQMLDHAGARPVGRRPDTGEPNLAPLFGTPSPSKTRAEESLAEKQNSPDAPVVDSRRLRNLADSSGTASSAITWSISRDNILHSCERRYYFQYLVSGRYNSKNPLHREIALLKQLQSIPTWEGDCFHVTVKHWATAQRTGRDPSLQAMLDWLRKQMVDQWKESSLLVGQNVPGTEISCRLFEHEYAVTLPPGQLEDSIARTSGWLTSFLAWACDAGIVDSIKNAKDSWIEPGTFGPKAPGFRVDGQKIVVKVDLAVQHKSGIFEIWDWKTGRLREANPRRIDPAALQVNVYQLWPHLSLGVPLDKIRAHLVYIGQDPVEDIVHEIDADVREYVLSIVRRSVDRVLHYSGGSDLEFNMQDFDYAMSPGYCRGCNFKRICARSVEEEEVSSGEPPAGNFTLFD